LIWTIDPDLLEDPNRHYSGPNPLSADRLKSEEARRSRYIHSLADRIHTALGKEWNAILEIGSGAGGLFLALAARGFEMEGIEPSPSLHEMALNQGVPVDRLYQLPLKSTTSRLRRQVYDVVLAIDVIEHFPDPWELPRFAAEHLGAGGLFLLQTPNAGSLRRRVQKTGWEQLAPGEHHVLHTVTSLSHLLSRTGFRVRDLKSISGGALDSERRSFWMGPLFEILRLAGWGNALWCVAERTDS
jgi:2-polyprenyl-3-methyl-5-hydroxy-6-metoxy-1,4-benzoquinol methylase